MLIVEARLDLEDVEGRRLVLESTRDVTQRKALQEQQQLLLGELTHRVKNTLAVEQSIAHQTEITSRSPQSSLSVSPAAWRLTNAHALLVQSEWQGADLRAPHANPAPALCLRQRQATADRRSRHLAAVQLATPFALVLHELARTPRSTARSPSKPGPSACAGTCRRTTGNATCTWYGMNAADHRPQRRAGRTRQRPHRPCDPGRPRAARAARGRSRLHD